MPQSEAEKLVHKRLLRAVLHWGHLNQESNVILLHHILSEKNRYMESDKLRFTNAQTKKQKITKISSTFPILDQVSD